ncbi:MAG: squalene synthase HpnC [Gammaproteobacteria bacterium HGW-Gammaproteobacteria-1]|jgi:squalene synthase HpnC|nr:MAG: squalene synthase HpnC [Gammaproteobacteria bacterium HGW-Gammaproteobacteria-1]
MPADAITAGATAYTLAQAYAYCEQLARNHYENFPVASRLLPARLRRPIAVIYAFARSADDFADECERTAAQRLTLLDGYAGELDALALGRPSGDPVFIALADVIARHRLPLQLFHDLLSAFRQDVTRQRYADAAELLDYCRRSANPVGHLLLHLNGAASGENLLLSDHVCTALQLINFHQDLLQDYDETGRIYIPGDEMEQYGIGPDHFRDRRNDEALRGLLRLQYRRSRDLMQAGAPLGRRLRGRFGWEIRLIVTAGLRVLERLEANLDTAPFSRPRLRRRDWPVILWRSVFD